MTEEINKEKEKGDNEVRKEKEGKEIKEDLQA